MVEDRARAPPEDQLALHRQDIARIGEVAEPVPLGPDAREGLHGGDYQRIGDEQDDRGQ